MRTYTGTQNVEPGLYLNVRTLSLKSVDTRGPLPGTSGDRYRRVPMLVMLALAPLLGLAYVIFLPFIGFAVVAWLLGQKAVQFAAAAATEAVRVVRPGWEPALAFLSRSKPPTKEAAAGAEDAKDAWSEDVERRLTGSARRGR